ncbi:MAG: hypothetical protein OEZ36_07030, partial [Spirochaetota bacterium]|nr:hypothetical protein [Spirochaetota bacterium]
MRIIFYDSIAIYWIILIIAVFVGYSVVVTLKEPKKRRIHLILFGIRSLALTAIILYMHKPAIQFINSTESFPPVPVFVDQSFSMAQDILPAKSDQRIPKAKRHRNLIR